MPSSICHNTKNYKKHAHAQTSSQSSHMQYTASLHSIWQIQKNSVKILTNEVMQNFLYNLKCACTSTQHIKIFTHLIQNTHTIGLCKYNRYGYTRFSLSKLVGETNVFHYIQFLREWRQCIQMQSGQILLSILLQNGNI